MITGAPGLAKTLLVKSIARIFDLKFQRIQFTPDLMPADITGTEILDEGTDGRRAFRYQRGPIFANLVLADEINRATPKTQSALLEAMQEKSVTAAGVNHQLPDPFFVLATQNPIEQEGTYPLPEAQLDRFLMKTKIGYPDRSSTIKLLNEAAIRNRSNSVGPLITSQAVADMAQLASMVYVDQNLLAFLADIADFKAFNGVYARFDLAASGFEATHLRAGTTNVDFHGDMRALLAAVSLDVSASGLVQQWDVTTGDAFAVTAVELGKPPAKEPVA